jgi:hypothetical protein
LGIKYFVVLCAGSALLLAEDESTSVVNGALVGVLLSQSASPSVVYLSSPRTIYLGFLTEGKLAAILITPFSWGSQRAGYFPHQLHASNKFSGAVAGERRRIISLVNWAPSNSRVLDFSPLEPRKTLRKQKLFFLPC